MYTSIHDRQHHRNLAGARQALRQITVNGEMGWFLPRLQPDQQEALDMICHKIGRILNGDPDYADSWHDIAGYAQLVADRLNGVTR